MVFDITQKKKKKKQSIVTSLITYYLSDQFFLSYYSYNLVDHLSCRYRILFVHDLCIGLLKF